MSARFKLVIIALAIAVQICAIAVLFPWMRPIRDGTSGEFWRLACGVDLDGAGRRPWGGAYPPRDGWYIYYVQGYDGQYLYLVERAKAAADFERVLAKLEQRVEKSDAPPAMRRVFQAYDHDRSQFDRDPDKFLALIHEAAREEFRAKDEQAYRYFEFEQQEFDKRWLRIRRYWWSAFFEAAFFAGLTLFAAWPWLWRCGRFRWSLHLGLVPLLLFLPFYLGYASWTFTSAGPSGGILYPWVIIWFRGFPLWTRFDMWLLERFPPLLEPLSQSLGPWLAITGGHPVGPVGVILVGGAIGGLTWIILTLAQIRKDSSTTLTAAGRQQS